MGGHQAYGIGAGGPPGEGVGGDVLGVDLLQEVEGPAPAGALLGARGRLEQGAHRVEVAVGVAPGGAAAQGGPLQPAGPGGAVPQGPQGLLGGAAAFEEFPGLAQERAEALRTVGVRRIVRDEAFGLGEGAGEQGVGGGGDPDSGGALLVAQGPAEAAQVGGVHGAEGGGEEGEGGLGVEPGQSDGAGRGVAGPVGAGLLDGPIGLPDRLTGRVDRLSGPLGRLLGTARTQGRLDRPIGLLGLPCRLTGPLNRVVGQPCRSLRPLGRLLGPARVQGRPGHRPQRRQQRGDGRFVAERDVVTVDLQRDPGGGEGTAYGGQRAAPGPYQHGHLLPRHPVLQMGAAQEVRDVLQLGGGGRIGVRLDAAALPDRGRFAVGADPVGGQPGQRHPAGQQPGRGEQAGPGAARGGEDAHGRGGPVRAPEGVREVEDAVHVGAPERVDRLVGVAERDQRPPAPALPRTPPVRGGFSAPRVYGARAGCAPPVPCQRVQQAHLGRVGVLVLVDVHRVVAVGQFGRHLGALREQHRPVHQLGVVQDPLGVEDVEVLREELGRRRPVRAAGAAGEGGQRVRAEPQLTAAGQHGAHLVREAAGGQAGAQLGRPADMGQALLLQVELAREQFADGDVLLGPGEQPQRVREEVGVLVGPDQGVAVRVEGGGLRTPGRPQPGGHPVAQLDGGLAAEGEDEDAGRVAAPLHAGGDGFDEGGGLARAGSGEDQQRPLGVINHRALACVQERGFHGTGRRAHQTVRTRGPLP